MSTKYYAFFLATICFTSVLFSQASQQARLFKDFQEIRALSAESVYVHTNKQKFITGERLWFTAYVRDSQEREQSILWLGIYDVSGKMINKNAYYMTNGIAYGDLKLEVPSGEYFIKANTHFDQSDDFTKSFIQRITVNREGSLTEDPNTPNENLVLHLKTASERLVAGTENKVHFYVKHWNPEKYFIRRAYVSDSKGEVVYEETTFDTSGMGSAVFSPSVNETYTLGIELYGDFLIKRALPPVQEHGIVMDVNPYLSKDVMIHLKQMKPMQGSIKNVHTLNFCSKNDLKTAQVEWSSVEKVVKFPKSEIPKGLNLVSLLDDEGILIAHQLFYNDNTFREQFTPFKLEYNKMPGDSIGIELIKEFSAKEIKNVSVSIMPLDYQDIDQGGSILNRDLAIDFADKETHSASRFFRIFSKKDIIRLNMALASIKASHYWKQLRHEQKSIELGKNVGFTLKGRAHITGIHDTRELLLLQNALGVFYKTSLTSSGDFLLKDVIIDKNESLNFVIKLNDKEKAEPTVDFKISPSVPYDSIPQEIRTTYRKTGNEEISKITESQIISNEDIALDEVVLIKKKEKNLTRNTKLGAVFEAKRIDGAILKRNKTLSTYVRSLGFKVVPDGFRIGNFIVSGRDFLDSAPVIYIDGFRTDGSSIIDRPLASVDEIYFEHVGVEGTNGGSLYIYLRYESLKSEREEVLFSIKPEVGYHFSKAYKNPIIQQVFTRSLREIAAVHWAPQLYFDEENKAVLAFPSFGLEGIKYSIQGVTAAGESIVQEGELFFEED